MSDEEKQFVTEYDAPWKDALDHAPELFLQRFSAKIATTIDWTEWYSPLDDELRKLNVQDHEGVRRVDRLLRFKTLDDDLMYLHVEVQYYVDRELGRRIMTYRHRIRGHWGQPAVTIVIFGDGNSRWCPKKHQEGQHGSTDSCTWIPVKLLQVGKEAPDLENEDNLFSLFIAAHLETLRTHKDLPARQQAKVRLLCNLQGRKVDEADGREWYRLIDYLMKLPEDMDREVHAEVLQQHTGDVMKYVSFAERQGIEKGIAQGEVIGRIHLCQELLKQPLTPVEELRELSLEELALQAEQLKGQLLSESHNGTT